MSNPTVLEIFEDVFKSFNEELPEDRRQAFSEDISLFGSQSSLESIEAVTILVNLEASLSDHFGRPIRLTDEKAMSQSSSPFRTVGTLTDYAASLIDESSGE
jgi:acyl carrier protein